MPFSKFMEAFTTWTGMFNAAATRSKLTPSFLDIADHL